MRRRTRNALLAIGAVLVVLIALGALPGLLKSGDPYRMTATVADDRADVGNASGLAGEGLAETRYPYARAALSDARPGEPGRSEPYWRGPVGLKEAFTHSPFDEIDALAARNPGAVTERGVYVRRNDTLYLLAVTREDT